MEFGSLPFQLPPFASEQDPTADEASSGRLGARPGRLDFQPGTLHLSWSDSLKKKGIWFWLRAQCDDNPEGASITWHCDAAGCGTMVVYDHHDLQALHSPKEPPSLTKPCTVLADGGALSEICDGSLVSVGRALAVDTVASLELICTNRRCGDRLARSIPVVRALAGAPEWRVADRHPRPTRLPGNEGRAWMIRLDTQRGSVDLACVRMTDYEGQPLECGLQLSTGKHRLTFSRDPMNDIRYVRIPGGAATISDNVVLSGSAIAARRAK